MGNNRDDFTTTTKRILAQRVAYKCSRPECRKQTIGPHRKEEKVTMVGVAAHIKAAAPRGPRYDNLLTPEERINIKNGIWLCPSCSTLIDKDPDKFPIEVLNEWKARSESMTWDELMQTPTTSERIINPILEMDLIWSGGGKYNRGINFKKTKELYSGPIHPNQTIYHNELFWKFHFSIYNNSSFPALNVKIQPIQGNEFFTYIDALPNINNIPPLENLDLEAKYIKFFEGTGSEAMKIIAADFPEELEGQKFKVMYQDETRKHHQVQVTLSEEGTINEHIILD